MMQVSADVWQWRNARAYRILQMIAVALCCCGAVFAEESAMEFPKQWTVFGPYDNGLQLPADEILAGVKAVPQSLAVGQTERRGTLVSLQDRGVDFTQIFGPLAERGDGSAQAAFLMGEIECATAQKLVIGCGADWWMRWYVDGAPVFSTMPGGNGQWNYDCANHVFTYDLTPGRHLLAVCAISGSQGWKLYFDQGEKYVELNRISRETAAEEARWQGRLIKEKAKINSRMKLVVYGSSVASGAGAPRGEGWAGLLERELRKRNWSVVNRSIGGDNTEKLLARFASDLLTEQPDVVVLALSLGNEGLLSAEPERIYRQYRQNMLKLIQLCRKHHVVPVVSSCYPNGGYKESHYSYIRKFNEELGSWPVASLNFLAPVDDAAGRWSKGTDKDAGHPNKLGHSEMFSAISPGMFDALLGDAAWSRPFAPSAGGFAQAQRGVEGFRYEPDLPVHGFTAFCSVTPTNGTHPSGTLFRAGALQLNLNVDGSASLLEGERELLRTPAPKQMLERSVVGLARHYLRNEALVLVNGEVHAAALSAPEALNGYEILRPARSIVEDVVLYRCALDGKMLLAATAGNFSRSSLDVFAPLNDAYLFPGLPAVNLAPSGGQLYVMQPAAKP